MSTRCGAIRSLPVLVTAVVMFATGSEPTLAAGGGHGGGGGHAGVAHGGYHGGYGPGFRGYYGGGFYGYPYGYGYGLGLGFGLGYGYGYGYGGYGGYYGYPYGYAYGTNYPYYGYPGGNYNGPAYGNPYPPQYPYPPSNVPGSQPLPPPGDYPVNGGPGQRGPAGGPPNSALSTLLGSATLPQVRTPETDVTLIVRALDNTVVWINGMKTNQTGPRREFVSAGPEVGRTYTFQVHAQWTGADGKTVDRVQTVPMQAGEKRVVDFTSQQPSSGQVTFSIPPLPITTTPSPTATVPLPLPTPLRVPQGP